MNVFTFDPKKVEEESRKLELLEVLGEITRQVEEGEIKELVACTVTADGGCQIHIACLDLPGGVGLFEIGKHMLIQTHGEEED